MSAGLGEGELPPLSHRMIFGLASDVKANVHYLEDTCVLYPAGHSVVLYDTETKTQRFIHGRYLLCVGRSILSSSFVEHSRKTKALIPKGTSHAFAWIDSWSLLN